MMPRGSTWRMAIHGGWLQTRAGPKHHLSLLVKWTGQLRAWQLHRVRIFHCDFSPRRKAFHSILPISFYSLPPQKLKTNKQIFHWVLYVSPDYRSQVEVRKYSVWSLTQDPFRPLYLRWGASSPPLAPLTLFSFLLASKTP